MAEQSLVTDEMVITAGDILVGVANAPEQPLYQAARTILEATAPAVWDQAVEACISECFHEEQLQVWSDEFLSELAAIGHVNPDTSYDDVVDMHRRFQDFLKHTVVSRICSLKRAAGSSIEERSDEVSPHGPEVTLTHKINQESDNG
jgi:hypothetical protein